MITMFLLIAPTSSLSYDLSLVDLDTTVRKHQSLKDRQTTLIHPIFEMDDFTQQMTRYLSIQVIPR